jgi:hypothetical protein
MNIPLPFEYENYAKEPLEIRSFLSKIERGNYILTFKKNSLRTKLMVIQRTIIWIWDFSFGTVSLKQKGNI